MSERPGADGVLPDQEALPRSRASILLRLYPPAFVGLFCLGFAVLCAWNGAWVGALLFAAGAGAVVLYIWGLASASLTLTRTGFIYRMWRKEWSCRWSDTMGFTYGGRRLQNSDFVNVQWVNEGPEFIWPGEKPGKESRIVWAFGMTPLELAQLMARFRERAVEAESIR